MPPTPQTINDHWNAYRANVLPQAASQTQLKEAHMAFYAGALAAACIAAEAIENSAITETAALRLNALFNELNAFGDAFNKRHGIKLP